MFNSRNLQKSIGGSGLALGSLIEAKKLEKAIQKFFPEAGSPCEGFEVVKVLNHIGHIALRQAQEPAHKKCECESEGDEGDSDTSPKLNL